MLRDFIAIDFETANQEPSSVCSVGVVMVRDGQIVDSFYSLIQPEPNYYSYFCQRVHGITQSDTDDAPVFSEVWQQLEERIADVFFPDQKLDDMRYKIATIPFVAHNARFDEGCLKAAFRVYQMDYPDYRFYDTLTASRRQFGHSLPNHQLRTVAATCGYDLQNHHHALADAEACASIAFFIVCQCEKNPNKFGFLLTYSYLWHRRTYFRSTIQTKKNFFCLYCPHLLDKIFTFEKINIFLFFLLNQIFRTFASEIRQNKIWDERLKNTYRR